MIISSTRGVPKYAVVAIIIGNNNPQNVEQLIEYCSQHDVKIIFDPWNLLLNRNDLQVIRNRRIRIHTLTTLRQESN